MATWRKEIGECLKEHNEDWEDVVAHTLSERELDLEFDDGWGGSGRDAHTPGEFRELLWKLSRADQKLLLFMVQKMSQRKMRAVD